MAICTSSGVTWSWILSFSNEGKIIRVNYAENKVDIFLKSKLDMFTLDLVALDRSKMLVASWYKLAIFDLEQETVEEFEVCSGCVTRAASLLLSDGSLYVGGEGEIVKITSKCSAGSNVSFILI